MQFEINFEDSFSGYSHFFLREYDNYLEHISTINDETGGKSVKNEDDTKLFERRKVELFLRRPEFKHWRGFLRFWNDSATAQ